MTNATHGAFGDDNHFDIRGLVGHRIASFRSIAGPPHLRAAIIDEMLEDQVDRYLRRLNDVIS